MGRQALLFFGGVGAGTLFSLLVQSGNYAINSSYYVLLLILSFLPSFFSSSAGEPAPGGQSSPPPGSPPRGSSACSEAEANLALEAAAGGHCKWVMVIEGGVAQQ